MPDSVLLKLDRAKEHLEAFQLESDAWIEGKPYRVIDERDPNPPPEEAHHGDLCRRFRFERIDQVPHRLSVFIGDCVFNARSALDHLALALAKKHTPSLTEQQEAGSEFPVFHAKPMDANIERRKIGCIQPTARRAIMALQPHHRGSKYRSHPLWQLHELNRGDKHRTLIACIPNPVVRDRNGVGTKAIGFRALDGGFNFGKTLYVRAPVVEHVPNAVLLQYAILPRDPDKGMNMEPHLPIEIAFGTGSAVPLQPVVPTLAAILDFVRNSVVSPLSQFL